MHTSTSRLSRALALPLLLAGLGALPACGDNHAGAGDAGPVIVDAAADAPVTVDAPPDANLACLAPFVVPISPTAEADATAALAVLSPTATLTWAPVRGTLQSIDGLTITLPGCTGQTNAFDQLYAVLNASPALFQIDAAEWNTGTEPCSDILANGFHPLTIRRTSYGPYALQNDVFTAVADVQAGHVILRNFSGTYIPKASPAVLAALAACPDIAHSTLAKTLLLTPFAYQEYEFPPAPACTASGEGSYTAMAADTLAFDPSVTTSWTESDVITIARQSAATLTVAAADYTPALENSDANCAGDGGVANVGWVRTFDAVTGAILFDHHSPDPFCTVCLK